MCFKMSKEQAGTMEDETTNAFTIPSILEDFYSTMKESLPCHKSEVRLRMVHLESKLNAGGADITCLKLLLLNRNRNHSYIMNLDDTENAFSLVTDMLRNLMEKVFYVFFQVNRSIVSQLAITSEETLKRFQIICPLIHDVYHSLRGSSLADLTSIDEVRTVYNEYIPHLMAEFALAFQDMRELATLPRQINERYDDMISSVDSLSQKYQQRLQTYSIPNEPDARINYLRTEHEEISALTYNHWQAQGQRGGMARGQDAGVSQATIDSNTASYKYEKAKTSPEMCVICRDDMKPGEDVRLLQCMHVFHRSCIDRSLKEKKQCPICRRVFDINNSGTRSKGGNAEM